MDLYPREGCGGGGGGGGGGGYLKNPSPAADSPIIY